MTDCQLQFRLESINKFGSQCCQGDAANPSREPIHLKYSPSLWSHLIFSEGAERLIVPALTTTSTPSCDVLPEGSIGMSLLCTLHEQMNWSEASSAADLLPTTRRRSWSRCLAGRQDPLLWLSVIHPQAELPTEHCNLLWARKLLQTVQNILLCMRIPWVMSHFALG